MIRFWITPTSSALLTRFGTNPAVSIESDKIANTSIQCSFGRPSIAEIGITSPHVGLLSGAIGTLIKHYAAQSLRKNGQLLYPSQVERSTLEHHPSRRQLLAHEAIASSRVSAKPCVGERSRWCP